MDMLPNVVRLGDSSYFIKDGLKFKITKIFIHYNPKRNLIDANAYMASKGMKEGVIWSSKDDRKIIICKCDDLGTPYIPRGSE